MNLFIGLLIGGFIGFILGMVIMWKSLRSIPGVTEAMCENGRNILSGRKK